MPPIFVKPLDHDDRALAEDLAHEAEDLATNHFPQHAHDLEIIKGLLLLSRSNAAVLRTRLVTVIDGVSFELEGEKASTAFDVLGAINLFFLELRKPMVERFAK